MKRFLPIAVVLLLVTLSEAGTVASAASPGAASGPSPLSSSPFTASTLLPPTSIELVAVPPVLPPGGSGMIVIQLVDANGLPSPARNGPVSVNLFSSNPSVATVVEKQIAIPYGKSHAEAEFSAGINGNATITAIANGYNPGSVSVTSSLFSAFSLSLTPMSNPVSPGDNVRIRVQLLASSKPYNTPVSVPVTLTTSTSGVGQQTVEIGAGTSCVYPTITIPSFIDAVQTPFVTLSAAAPGFTSSQTMIRLSRMASMPQMVVAGPPGATLVAGSAQQYLSVALFNQSLVPAAATLTLSVFSSNASVVNSEVSQISITGSDSATFAVYANAAGTAQMTAVAPGLLSIPIKVTVVNPYGPELRVFVPSVMRAGEHYSFAVEFMDRSGTTPMTYGPATIYTSSSSESISAPTSLEASQLGYAVGTLTAKGSGSAGITAVMEGAPAGTGETRAVIVPLVATVTYTVTAVSDAGPLGGVPLNFSSSGENQTVLTNQHGQASIRASNGSATLIMAPNTYSVQNKTFYFTGWSNTAKKTSVAIIASGNYNIQVQYFRSVVPTTYALIALGDGGKPIAGLRFNVTGGTGTFSLKTGSSGKATFLLPNATSFKVAIPALYQPSGGTRYNSLGIMNYTKNSANFTSSQGFTVEARYATYYYLDVLTSIGQATGAGWYRSGSAASYSTDVTSTGGPMVYQRFAGWTGSLTSNQPSGSILMDSPKSLTAQWAEDNSTLFAAAGGAVTAAAILGVLIFRLKKRAVP